MSWSLLPAELELIEQQDILMQEIHKSRQSKGETGVSKS